MKCSIDFLVKSFKHILQLILIIKNKKQFVRGVGGTGLKRGKHYEYHHPKKLYNPY
jgi:hypothetical protein